MAEWWKTSCPVLVNVDGTILSLSKGARIHVAGGLAAPIPLSQLSYCAEHLVLWVLRRYR
eukprot:2906739-Pyramimonas_sp.AAC.1